MRIQRFAWGFFLSAAMAVSAGDALTISVSPAKSFHIGHHRTLTIPTMDLFGALSRRDHPS